MKLEIYLCELVQRVASIDKSLPCTWVVVVNHFLLQKEHESDLLLFKRSMKINLYCTCAHTLSTHDHMFNEDLDNDALSFSNAFRIKTRHHYAWHRSGNGICRQEKNI